MITRKSKHEFKVTVPIGNKPVTVDDLDAMIAWCEQTLGLDGRNPKYRWRYGWIDQTKDSFYFRHESDAFMFVLRWS